MTVPFFHNKDNNIALEEWQKKIIDERLNDYYKNSDNVVDFDNMINDIEKTILTI